MPYIRLSISNGFTLACIFHFCPDCGHITIGFINLQLEILLYDKHEHDE